MDVNTTHGNPLPIRLHTGVGRLQCPREHPPGNDQFTIGKHILEIVVAVRKRGTVGSEAFLVKRFVLLGDNRTVVRVVIREQAIERISVTGVEGLEIRLGQRDRVVGRGGRARSRGGGTLLGQR